MKQTIAIVLAGLLCSSAFAQEATCSAQATEKKLAGAAKTSFLKNASVSPLKNAK